MADFFSGALLWILMGLVLAISVSFLSTRKKNEDSN